MDFRGVALATVVALVPVACAADELPTDIGAPTTLTVDLVGQIPSRCGFSSAPASSVSLGDLSKAGTVDVDFALSCNSTFAIRIASENNALRHVDPSLNATDTHDVTLDYDVALSFTTDLGTVADHCAASALGAGACALHGTGAGEGLSSGNGVCFGENGSLKISWQVPSKQLYAGQYQDSLTIIVEPRT